MKRHTSSDSQRSRRPGDARSDAGLGAPLGAFGAGAWLGGSIVDALARAGEVTHQHRQMPAYAKDIPGGIARDRRSFGTNDIGAGIGRGGRAR